MRVAYVLPSIHIPSGWRSFCSGLINALSHYVDPIIFVAASDMEVATSLFPHQRVFSLPLTQRALLTDLHAWPALSAFLFEIIKKRFRRRGQGHGHGHNHGRDHDNIFDYTHGYGEIDLVHSLEAYPTGLIGFLLARELRKPHVISAIGTYAVLWANYRIHKFIYGQILKRARAIFPISQGTAALIKKHFGQYLHGVPIQTILCGNDYARSISREAALNREFPEIPTILSVGVIIPRKGYHISLAAFAKVKEQLPQARYWIVGSIDDVNYFKQLQHFIAAHRLKDVEFLGEVSEEKLRQCYEQASLFLLTPQQIGLYFEGFGLVYLEAGAYGLPVIGTKTGGVPDAVKDGVTGLLFEPGDVEGLSRGLLLLLTNRDLARKFGQANRDWAETLTWERSARQYYEAYLDLIKI
jgi:glycosyltransferase involved in cell wall biosynthesis